MAQTVRDVAILLNAIVGEDSNDVATRKSRDNIFDDYTTVLKKNAMKGARIGIPRQFQASLDFEADWDVFEHGINILREMGADLVNVEFPGFDEFLKNRQSQGGNPSNTLTKLLFEFKAAINKYLSTLVSIPTNATTLAGLINFNEENAFLEFPPTQGRQDLFIASEDTTNLEDPRYIDIRDKLLFLTRDSGIDAVVETYDLDAFVAPADSNLAVAYTAIAGYPIISVPQSFFDCSEMQDVCPGYAESTTTNIGYFPRGFTFFGPAWSEPKLLALAYAFEQYTKVREQGSPSPIVTAFDNHDDKSDEDNGNDSHHKHHHRE
jgi:amidase